jgi:hypothetical protein
MKELAKELAPLVASEMRNTNNGEKAREKVFRPLPRTRGKTERDEEGDKERLGFLVSGLTENIAKQITYCS